MTQRGFTLIEILIAMAIFTLIGLASTGLLTTVIDSNELSTDRFAKLQQLQRAMITIERDIQQAVARPIRVEGEKQDVVMFGTSLEDSDGSALGFVRGGRHNPQLMLPRSSLQYVGYRMRDNALERIYTNYVDNVIGYEPKTRVLLDNIESFTVEFIPPDKKVSDSTKLTWVNRYQGTTLPKAVAVEFMSTDFGLLRREFALTGVAN